MWSNDDTQRRRAVQILTAMLPLVAPWLARRAAAQPSAGHPAPVGILGTTTASGFAGQWDAFR